MNWEKNYSQIDFTYMLCGNKYNLNCFVPNKFDHFKWRMHAIYILFVTVPLHAHAITIISFILYLGRDIKKNCTWQANKEHNKAFCLLVSFPLHNRNKWREYRTILDDISLVILFQFKCNKCNKCCLLVV